MKKSLGLTEKIVSGKKTVESRWYTSKRLPWNSILPGDTIFFKDSGEPITIRAQVQEVRQFSDLTHDQIIEIFDEFGANLGILPKDMPGFLESVKGKKYCVLAFLCGVEKIEPIHIDKRGLGNMSAWICTDDIMKIAKKPQPLRKSCRSMIVGSRIPNATLDTSRS